MGKGNPADPLPNDWQTAACIELVQSTVNSGSLAALSNELLTLLDYVLAADFPQMVARPTVTEYVNQLSQIKDREQRKEIMAASLDKMQPRTTTFEEQVSIGGRPLEWRSELKNTHQKP